MLSFDCLDRFVRSAARRRRPLSEAFVVEVEVDTKTIKIAMHEARSDAQCVRKCCGGGWLITFEVVDKIRSRIKRKRY